MAPKDKLENKAPAAGSVKPASPAALPKTAAPPPAPSWAGWLGDRLSAVLNNTKMSWNAVAFHPVDTATEIARTVRDTASAGLKIVADVHEWTVDKTSKAILTIAEASLHPKETREKIENGIIMTADKVIPVIATEVKNFTVYNAQNPEAVMAFQLQGILNAGAVTVGMVGDLGLGTINYVGRTITNPLVTFVGLAPIEKTDFSVSDYLENKWTLIRPENEPPGDQIYARANMYFTQAVGEVGAFAAATVVTAGAGGAVYAELRGGATAARGLRFAGLAEKTLGTEGIANTFRGAAKASASLEPVLGERATGALGYGVRTATKAWRNMVMPVHKAGTEGWKISKFAVSAEGSGMGASFGMNMYEGAGKDAEAEQKAAELSASPLNKKNIEDAVVIHMAGYRKSEETLTKELDHQMEVLLTKEREDVLSNKSEEAIQRLQAEFAAVGKTTKPAVSGDAEFDRQIASISEQYRAREKDYAQQRETILKKELASKREQMLSDKNTSEEVRAALRTKFVAEGLKPDGEMKLPAMPARTPVKPVGTTITEVRAPTPVGM